MALDSRQKRAAVIGTARAWYRNPHPSNIDAAQRASIGQGYPVTSFVVIVYGGTFNASEYFASGQNDVVIALYDPITGSAVALDSSSCIEIGSTGLYIWDAANITTAPTGYQEYAYTMTDGVTTSGGMIRMGDNATVIRDAIFGFEMENGETFAEQTRLIRADAAGTIVRDGTLHEIKSADGLTTRITATASSAGREVTDTDGA